VCASCGLQRRERKRVSGNGRDLCRGLAALEQCNGSAGCKNLQNARSGPIRPSCTQQSLLICPVAGARGALYSQAQVEVEVSCLGVCTQSCHPIGCLLDALPKRAGSAPLCVWVDHWPSASGIEATHPQAFEGAKNGLSLVPQIYPLR
jgi:hypothetical protein